MTTLNYYRHRLRRICLVTGLNLILAACQTVPPDSATDSDRRTSNSPAASAKRTQAVALRSPELITPTITAPVDLWGRMQSGFALQDFYDHPNVLEHIDNYLSDPRFFEIVTARAQPFLFSIVEELEAREMPLEIALLPVVESTFNPNAASGEGAVGLWQIVSNTGQRYGLQEDWWYDGRRDPLASTTAALDFLQVLHNQFDNDWLLTLAAYNTGGGNLRRAIRRSGQSLEAGIDFWELPLANETRVHIPRILAVAAIIANAEQYAVELPELANENQLARIELGTQIELAEAARLAEIDIDTLRMLNAGYRQWATHPDTPQHLYLPIDNAATLQAALSKVDLSSLMTWDHYEIQSGDTLGAIASRFSTTVDVLRQVNNLRGSFIVAGDPLLIPRDGGSGQIVGTPPQLSRQRSIESAPATYTIRRGDNLWSIARRFALSIADITRHNGLNGDALLMPGQELDLSFANDAPRSALAQASTPGNSPQTYRIRRGDTLATIARRFDVPLAELLNWNDLSANDIIYPGDNLRVAQPIANP